MYVGDALHEAHKLCFGPLRVFLHAAGCVNRNIKYPEAFEPHVRTTPLPYIHKSPPDAPAGAPRLPRHFAVQVANRDGPCVHTYKCLGSRASLLGSYTMNQITFIPSGISSSLLGAKGGACPPCLSQHDRRIGHATDQLLLQECAEHTWSSLNSPRLPGIDLRPLSSRINGYPLTKRAPRRYGSKRTKSRTSSARQTRSPSLTRSTTRSTVPACMD